MAHDVRTNIKLPALTTPPIVQCYGISRDELFDITNFIKTSTYLDDIKLLFKDPIQNIVGCKLFPFDFADHVLSETVEKVKISNINTNVDGIRLWAQLKPLDVGTITIPTHFDNFLDYAPYTKIEMFLPYCGFIELDTNLVMGKTIKIEYAVDVINGLCRAYINLVEGEGTSKVIIQTADGKIGADVPIGGTSGSQIGRSVLTNVLGASTSMIGGVIGAYGGSQQALASGKSTAGMTAKGVGKATGYLGQTAINTINSMYSAYQKGQAPDGIIGMYEPQNAYLIITRPVPVFPTNYESLIGRMSGESKILGDLTGFTAVEGVHVEGIDATANEISEIESLLRSGVIL